MIPLELDTQLVPDARSTCPDTGLHFTVTLPSVKLGDGAAATGNR